MRRASFRASALAVIILVSTPVSHARTEPVAIGCGDVTADAFTVWGRASGAGRILTEVDTDDAFSKPRNVRFGLDNDRHFAGQARIDGLEPDTEYYVRLSTGNKETITGRCRTAPAADQATPVRFVIGGDVGGQSYCRHAEHGYQIFAGIRARAPHFFIANGDSIYADGTCPESGPGGWPNVPGTFPSISDPAIDWTNSAEVRAVILDHWLYNSEDPHMTALFAETPRYVQWDDHEVVNDFGASRSTWPANVNRAGYKNLIFEAREAFLAYNPIHMADNENRLYRSFRWGRELELFVLDGRSYRDPNDHPDGPEKTLLGAEQRQWLIDGLLASDATWKVVSSNVPLAVPTGGRADQFGRDGFANGTDDDFSARTGFEYELLTILGAIESRVENLVFVVTDVHVAATLRHTVDLDNDGHALVFHELISGPLNAGMGSTLQQLDPTLRPVILFSEGGVFNFGDVEIEPATVDHPSRLIYTVRDEHGEIRSGSRLELTAQAPP